MFDYAHSIAILSFVSTPTAHNDTGDKSPSREASTSQLPEYFVVQCLGDNSFLQGVGEGGRAIFSHDSAKARLCTSRDKEAVWLATSPCYIAKEVKFDWSAWREHQAGGNKESAALTLLREIYTSMWPSSALPSWAERMRSILDLTPNSGGPANVELTLAEAVPFATNTLGDEGATVKDLREALEALVGAVTSEVPAPGDEPTPHTDCHCINCDFTEAMQEAREALDNAKTMGSPLGGPMLEDKLLQLVTLLEHNRVTFMGAGL